MRMLFVIVSVLLLAAMAFYAGRLEGIRHAIEDSQIWTADCYDPDNPNGSAWNGFDQQIYIDLDGQRYEHGMTQC